MSEVSFNNITQYTRKKIGDKKSHSSLVVDWIKSALCQWSHSGSIASFAPFEAQMSRDRSFDDLLLELLLPLVRERTFDGFDAKTLVCSALLDALQVSLDENKEWEANRSIGNEKDFSDASLHTATLLAVFQTLQHFDSESSMRWASNLLHTNSTSIGFLNFSTEPFAITLFAKIHHKHAKSEARSAFFIALYEWAENNTFVPQVIARFPDLLLLRLEAIYGHKRDEKQFDVLCSVFKVNGVQNLQPIQVIDKSIADEIDDYEDDNILHEFSGKLSNSTSIHVARYIREMSKSEKNKWLESETLRATFWDQLNCPPVPEYNSESEFRDVAEGSALAKIFGEAHA